MLSNPVYSTLASPIQSVMPHMRRLSRPSFRWGLVLSCMISVMLVMVYVVHLRSIDYDFYIAPPMRWPHCPIPTDAEDICIHTGINASDLTDVCGIVEASFSHCQDRFYGFILTPMQAMEAVSEHTQRMVVQSATDIGGELDAFIQRRSHWVIDTMGVPAAKPGGESYEMLTAFVDKDRLALHQALDQLQHRCDRFFYGASNPYGFGSAWHSLGLGLAFSLHYNMTLYNPDPHKYFIPLTSCTEADMEKAFSAHPPETNFEQWTKDTVNFKSLQADVPQLMSKNTLIVPEYRRKGYFWWRSMLTYYAVRPNAQLRGLIRNNPVAIPLTTRCISIHVRHSDKGYEAELLDFSKYMAKAKQYKTKTGVSTIYLMTDDDQVIQSTKNYPDFQFHYLPVSRSNQGWEADIQAGISKEQQEANFLIDVYSAARCQHNILTYSSNVGRLIAEIAFATRNKEPDVVSLDQKWKMDP